MIETMKGIRRRKYLSRSLNKAPARDLMLLCLFFFNALYGGLLVAVSLITNRT